MSRDRTSDEVIDDIMWKPRREVEDLELKLRILRDTARAEGAAEARKAEDPGTGTGPEVSQGDGA